MIIYVVSYALECEPQPYPYIEVCFSRWTAKWAIKNWMRKLNIDSDLWDEYTEDIFDLKEKKISES